MKKTVFLIVVSLLTLAAAPAWSKTSTFDGKGMITSVDPLYGRVTIKHRAIKGFAGDEETEFFVARPDVLKGFTPRDLVNFSITETNGDVKIEKLEKTGVAEPEEKAGMGRVVQDVLVGTGEVAKTVTKPITPAHDVVSGTFDAATNVTGPVLQESDDKAKQDF